MGYIGNENMLVNVCTCSLITLCRSRQVAVAFSKKHSVEAIVSRSACMLTKCLVLDLLLPLWLCQSVSFSKQWMLLLQYAYKSRQKLGDNSG
jgi:hypothetical protein